MAKYDAYAYLADNSDKIQTRGRCKLWQGAKNSKGYAKATIDGKQVLVHRYVLALKLNRPIKQGMFACHKCQNRNCIAPGHLYEGTQSQNELDKHS